MKFKAKTTRHIHVNQFPKFLRTKFKLTEKFYQNDDFKIKSKIVLSAEL